MPYIVVRNDGPTGHSGPEAPRSVLSRVSPDALLSWVDIGVSRATDYRYAVLFETCSGALKCAGIYGGEAHVVNAAAETAAAVVSCGNPSRGVGACGNDSGLVEVE